MDIGIDLGTTFSVIAVNGKVELADDYPPGIYLEECDVTIIPSAYGEATFPSVVMQDPDTPDEYLFGSDALKKAEEGFAPVMFSKRKIGTKEAIPMQTRTIVAKEVACKLLRCMKDCAERALGESISRAVVTHPAYFDRGAVEETREAAREAGFDMSLPEQMLMEPVAAALSYARSDRRDPLRILTYDMGGGTFDVTYLVRREGVIDMRAFDGDYLLGGYNFDRELVHWIRERLKERGRHIELDESRPEDRGRLFKLLRLAERVKIDLANARTDSVMVDVRARDILVDAEGRRVQINERISRQQFVQLIRPHLDRAAECCRRALEKAKVQPGEVDEILLVGGSTYGPWVRESLKGAFPNLTPKLFNPDLCVGAEAAIHARMALPPFVGDAEYRLTLDVPETSVLDRLNVTGRVTAPEGGPAKQTLRAFLRLPETGVLDQVPLDKNGRFLFENIELVEDESNRFTLEIRNSDGTPVLAHTFAVGYAPEAAETSGVRTVLPKPLFIETVDGLVAIAEEGVSLPAKCSPSFRRVNDNPNITLRLFQQQDPIGEVRIENIPPEGGRGSFVDLEVEVTEKNQIRGTATIRTPGGKTVVQAEVRVHFEVPEIAPAEELRDQFNTLKARLLGLILSDAERREEIGTRGIELVKNVEHLFEQQPLERQEVHVALRRLNNLLNPPEDEMKPTREEFNAIVERCKEALRERKEKANDVIERSKSDEADTLDQQLVTNARESLEKVNYYGQALERLEKQGLAAHERKDRLTWARIHDAITDLEIQLHERPKVGALPTVIHRLLAGHQVILHVEQVDQKAQEIADRGELDDWRDEIERIQHALNAALRKIREIDDDLPDDQGLAQIRRVFGRVVGPLQESINNLGKDIKIR